MSLLRRSSLTAFVLLLFSLVVPITAATSGTVSAHCTGSGTGFATQSAYGKEYNINYGTCDSDTVYTGRFCDRFTDGVRIKMWNSTSGYSAASSAQSCGFLWTYDDINTTSNFRICHFTSSLAYIGCATTGTDVGH
jgi:hypothetical protein